MIYHSAPGADCAGDPYDLEGLQDTVDQAVADLRSKARYIDSLVVTGMSGVIVGVPVSLALGIPLVIFRKPSDDSHARVPAINLDQLGQRALFLDDFVYRGGTRDRVRTLVAENGGRLVGEYLYRDNKLTFGVTWRRDEAARLAVN